jgi:hypothetical protein
MDWIDATGARPQESFRANHLTFIQGMKTRDVIYFSSQRNAGSALWRSEKTPNTGIMEGFS